MCLKQQQEGCYFAVTTARYEKSPAYWLGLLVGFLRLVGLYA
jgi:hypothetical protein